MSILISKFRFSLRCLLVAFTVVGVSVAIVGKFYVFKQEQRRVLSKLVSLRGFAETADFYGSPESLFFNPNFSTPGSRAIEDSDGPFLATLENVRGINLANTMISDQFLPHLAKLRDLEWVNLEGTNTTWAALKELELKLSNCVVYHDKNPEWRFGMRSTEIAEINFYAMREAIVATQIFVRENNGRWPSSWDDLKKVAPDHFELNCAARVVDFDFDPDVSQLSEQSWKTFSGIRPPQPCCTNYDKELEYLIAMLSQNRAE